MASNVLVTDTPLVVSNVMFSSLSKSIFVSSSPPMVSEFCEIDKKEMPFFLSRF
jgi:hypothetical protein